MEKRARIQQKQKITDQFAKLIHDNASEKNRLANIIVKIVEHADIINFSEFLLLPEICEVIFF